MPLSHAIVRHKTVLLHVYRRWMQEQTCKFCVTSYRPKRRGYNFEQFDNLSERKATSPHETVKISKDSISYDLHNEETYGKGMEIPSFKSSKPAQIQIDELPTGGSFEKLLAEATSNDLHDIPPEFPSDIEMLYNTRPRARTESDLKCDQTKDSYRPMSINPNETSVLLFPGQGAQYPGMAADLVQYPDAKHMFDVASRVLGYDLLDLCINGPMEQLSKTVHCQPAIFVTSLAAIEKLIAEKPSAIEGCVATAGFSIGELSALVFAGAMSFEDGMMVVKARAEAMQKASEEVPSGMMSVFIKADSKLKFAMHVAKKYCIERMGIPNPVCEIANYLYPQCKVIAGHEEALNFIEKAGKEFGLARTRRIPVSGAFHTPLMSSAAGPLYEVLKRVNFSEPIVPVHCNATAKMYTNVKTFPKTLAQHIVQPVKWEQIMHTVYSRPQGNLFPDTYELGPGSQLGSFLKQVNSEAYKQYESINVGEKKNNTKR